MKNLKKENKSLNPSLNIGLFIAALSMMAALGCSSSGKKAEGFGQGSHSDDLDPLAGSSSMTSPNTNKADLVANKKELYNNLQLALKMDEDGPVEKAVAGILSQDKSDSKALNSLALFHRSKGRLQLAKMILKSVVDKDPKNVTAINNLGVIYGEEGERRKATELYRKALSINSGYPLANANLGLVLAEGHDFVKARRHLEIAYKSGLRDLNLLNSYAAALIAEGQSEAENVLQEALAKGSSDFNAHWNYALYLMYIKKDYKEAREFIDKIRILGVPSSKRLLFSKMEDAIKGSAGDDLKAP